MSKHFIFGADLWQRPEGYEPPAIHHDDPLVMAIAKAIMSASPEGLNWDYEMRGATQGHEYYEIPYRQNIADHIAMAVAVREILP
jgi:hypothetical protein